MDEVVVRASTQLRRRGVDVRFAFGNPPLGFNLSKQNETQSDTRNRRVGSRQSGASTAMRLGSRWSVSGLLMLVAMATRRRSSCIRGRHRRAAHAERHQHERNQHQEPEECRCHAGDIGRRTLPGNDCTTVRLAGAAGFEPANAGTKRVPQQKSRRTQQTENRRNLRLPFSSKCSRCNEAKDPDRNPDRG